MELARVSRVREGAEEAQAYGGSSSTDWSRITLALMSDGAVLRKLDVRFKFDGRKHSYGWKNYAKAKPGLTPERFVEVFTARGYTVEHSHGAIAHNVGIRS